MFFGPNMTNIATLPREVLLQVFSLLPYRDLVSVRRTCLFWHSLSQDDILLQNIGKIEIKEKGLPKKNKLAKMLT